MKEKKVKQVFHDMGINNCDDLPENLEQQLAINQTLFKKNMQFEEEIELLLGQIQGLRKKKSVKREIPAL